MSALLLGFRRIAGVPFWTLGPLFATGAAVIVLSAPSLLSPSRTDSWPALSRRTVRALSSWTLDYRKWSHSPSVEEFTRHALAFCVLLALTIPIAAILRSLRAQHLEPILTITYAFALGILSFPIVLWTIWAGRLLYHLARYLIDQVDKLVLFLHPLFYVLGWIAAIVVVVALAAAAVWGVYLVARELLNNAQARSALMLALAVMGVGVLAWALVDSLSKAVLVFLHVVGLALAWLITQLVRLLIWAAIIVAGVVAASMAVMVIAQIGSTFWLPMFAARRAGREQSASADYAAGVGVSCSILMTIATVTHRFHTNLEQALVQNPPHVHSVGCLPRSDH